MRKRMLRQHTMTVTIGLAGGLLLLAVLVSLVGWGGGAPQNAPEPVERVRTERLLAGLTSAPDTLDPHTATTDAAAVVLDQVYDTLVRPGDDLLPRPALASSWEVSDDALTWTFTLREDVTFHDGSALTADDVVASLRRAADEGTDAARLAVIEEVEATDEHTVDLHLARPTGGLLALLGSSPAVAIVPEESITSADLGSAPVGSGPFRVIGADDATLELERFDEYFDGAPPLESLAFRVVDDADWGLAELRAGNLDWLSSLPAQETEEVDADEALHLARRAGLEYWHLAFNLDREPVDDRGVRRALARAVDREQLADAARPSGATPNHTPVPEGTFWHHDHAPFPHDPDRARDRLDEADLDDSALELLVTDELPESAVVAEALVEQLSAVGIEVTVRTEELEDLLVAQAEGDFDVFALGWRGSIDPDELFVPPHYSRGSRNFHGFVDDEVDDLLEEARRRHDPERRRALYAEVTEVVLGEAAYVYLFNTDVVRAWSADLVGVELRPDGAVRFDGAELDR
jgi:peptide/nickel transport system substrate-binding protein